MFPVYCHEHRSRVLLDMSRIERLTNTPDGPVLHWHCWCGARGRLLTGTRSVPHPTGHSAVV